MAAGTTPIDRGASRIRLAHIGKIVSVGTAHRPRHVRLLFGWPVVVGPEQSVVGQQCSTAQNLVAWRSMRTG